LVNLQKSGQISQHDYFLADQLASVICGGDVNQDELVDEDPMLELEKQALMRLTTLPYPRRE
jgi:3-hydroxyacyl-CoA dehydrogenase